MYIQRAYGRTKEEALSNLGAIMIRKHPDLPYARYFATVSEYGNENSDNKYVAEYELY